MYMSKKYPYSITWNPGPLPPLNIVRNDRLIVLPCFHLGIGYYN